jgi:hypothetical protein
MPPFTSPAYGDTTQQVLPFHMGCMVVKIICAMVLAAAIWSAYAQGSKMCKAIQVGMPMTCNLRLTGLFTILLLAGCSDRAAAYRYMNAVR